MVRKRIFTLLILIIAGALASCQLLPSALFQPTASPTQSASAEIEPLESEAPSLSSRGDRLSEIYQLVNPGVVAIQTLTVEGGSQGSGWVYDKQGHIITNFHVVEGATDLEVDFPSGIKVRGTVIATDKDSDLAVIEVAVSPDDLYPLTMGDSSTLQVGETVIAIGNPFGLNSSMTVGIISALGRTLESLRLSPSGGYFSTSDVIQTDAAINPGNSGGPLLNIDGQVIGINRAIQTAGNSVYGVESGNIGIGFAIPINIVKKVVPELIANGAYAYPYLGLSSIDQLSLIQLEALGLENVSGAYVVSVVEDGPADKAGLQGGTTPTEIPDLLAGGDVILAIDGMRINTFSEFLTYLIQYKSPGDKVTLSILRGGQNLDVEVTLGNRP